MGFAICCCAALLLLLLLVCCSDDTPDTLAALLCNKRRTEPNQPTKPNQTKPNQTTKLDQHRNVHRNEHRNPKPNLSSSRAGTVPAAPSFPLHPLFYTFQRAHRLSGSAERLRLTSVHLSGSGRARLYYYHISLSLPLSPPTPLLSRKHILGDLVAGFPTGDLFVAWRNDSSTPTGHAGTWGMGPRGPIIYPTTFYTCCQTPRQTIVRQNSNTFDERSSDEHASDTRRTRQQTTTGTQRNPTHTHAHTHGSTNTRTRGTPNRRTA